MAYRPTRGAPANGGTRHRLLPQPLRAATDSGRGSEGIAGGVRAASQQRGSLSPHPKVRTLLVIAFLFCNSRARPALAGRVTWDKCSMGVNDRRDRRDGPLPRPLPGAGRGVSLETI